MGYIKQSKGLQFDHIMKTYLWSHKVYNLVDQLMGGHSVLQVSGNVGSLLKKAKGHWYPTDLL